MIGSILRIWVVSALSAYFDSRWNADLQVQPTPNVLQHVLMDSRTNMMLSTSQAIQVQVLFLAYLNTIGLHGSVTISWHFGWFTLALD